ncbi:hypothetical protein [Nostoc sp.]|uniref:hypothetical protein n=1 Tax=Nostoc sp. TaxID=1180 RepID=UPI002FF74578
MKIGHGALGMGHWAWVENEGLTNKKTSQIFLWDGCPHPSYIQGGLSCPPHKMDNLFLVSL